MVKMGLFPETRVSMTESLKGGVIVSKEALLYTTGALPGYTNI